MGVVEAGLERRGRQRAGHLGIGGEQLPERSSRVRRGQGVALDDGVGLLTREAAFLDEREQDPARGMQAEASLDVLCHPVGAHDEPVDEMP